MRCANLLYTKQTNDAAYFPTGFEPGFLLIATLKYIAANIVINTY